MRVPPASTTRLLALTLGLSCAAAIGCQATPAADSIAAQRVTFPHQWQGDIDKADFNEPSGACIHPDRGTLFVVGDEGHITELATNGTVKQSQTLQDGADLEGITVHPRTGMLYVAHEGAEKILEVDPESLSIRRTFTIGRMFEGRVRMAEGGDGIEGITFIPNVDHPEGGVFMVAHQSFTLDDPNEPSALMRVEVPLRTGVGRELEAAIVGMLPMPIIDMSALHYDDQRDVIYALSDAHNVILTVDHNGALIDLRAFPGNDQEGLAIDPAQHVYIAQDSGGIIKVKWLR